MCAGLYQVVAVAPRQGLSSLPVCTPRLLILCMAKYTWVPQISYPCRRTPALLDADER